MSLQQRATNTSNDPWLSNLLQLSGKLQGPGPNLPALRLIPTLLTAGNAPIAMSLLGLSMAEVATPGVVAKAASLVIPATAGKS